MDYIKKIFSRMTLQEVRNFILQGQDIFAENHITIPYKEYLKNESEPIHDRLRSLYPDEEQFNTATADLYKAMNAQEIVYTELGMKAGARLIYQLLLADD